MLILDGKKLAEKIKLELKEKVAQLKEKPGLAVILIGDNPASKLYIDLKIRFCQEIGFYSEKIIFSEEVLEEELFKTLDRLNNDQKIHGILVQLPLPKRLSYLEKKIISFINPKKDVDCLHPLNIGQFFLEREYHHKMILPSTPKGIIRLLKEYQIDLKGKKAVICGRSNLVGKPLAILLTQNDATVTLTHSKTKNIFQITKTADILVVAIGRANWLKKEGVKKEAVVIDVGINQVEGKLFGDVDFEDVKGKVKAITPVPGGVGPMTVAMLMENVYLNFLYNNF